MTEPQNLSDDIRSLCRGARCRDFIQAKAARTQQSRAVQLRALSQQVERLHVPQSTRRTDHFLPWLLDCQTRKEHRNLPDAVAIQYAIMAMGDILRGIFLRHRPSQIGMGL